MGILRLAVLFVPPGILGNVGCAPCVRDNNRVKHHQRRRCAVQLINVETKRNKVCYEADLLRRRRDGNAAS